MCILSFERRRLLTLWFQKEFTKDGRVTTFTIRHDVVNTDAIASDVRNDAVNTSTSVSDSRRNTLKSSEDARGQGLRVSIFVLYLSPSNYLTLPRLMPGQLS